MKPCGSVMQIWRSRLAIAVPHKKAVLACCVVDGAHGKSSACEGSI